MGQRKSNGNYLRGLSFLLLIGFLVLLAILLWRAYQFVPDYVEMKPETPRARFDSSAAASRLSRAISFRTITRRDQAKLDSSSFFQFHQFLQEEYREFNAVAERETIAELSLLYRWEGTDSSLDPLLLAGHLDVTPIEAPDTWSTPPFEGVVSNGFIRGRGAIDNKGGVIAIMEAMELMAASGHEPERTIYLAFGHDEETGGHRGARSITDHLQSQGIELYAVIDEGGIIASDVLDDVKVPVALVGIAEKGSVNLRLSVSDQGGHSSAPPEETSIEVLGKAVSRVAELDSDTEITGPVRLFLDSIGPLFPFGQRIFLANRWLFGRLVTESLLDSPHTAAMVQTSITTTMISGGNSANVLPATAEAIVNIRLLPGDSTRDAIARIREAIDDPRVDIVTVSNAVEASKVSPAQGPVYSQLEQAIGGLTGSRTVLAPYLFVAGSDSKHYGNLTGHTYRFSGLQLSGDELKTIHGPDERLSIESLASAINFYYSFSMLAAQGD